MVTPALLAPENGIAAAATVGEIGEVTARLASALRDLASEVYALEGRYTVGLITGHVRPTAPGSVARVGYVAESVGALVSQVSASLAALPRDLLAAGMTEGDQI